MSKIIRLEANNFKRLKAVEITPDGNLVVISGRNGQGKTSVLDAITAALGGTSTKATPRPIRDGENRASIVLETEDLIVTRTFSGESSKLTVKGKDGSTHTKGQAKLDTLLGRLSLDPLAFTQLSEKEQVKTLLELVDLPFDPATLDAERAAIFDQRTDINRDVKQLTAQRDAYAAFPVDTPTEEVSVSDLLNAYRIADAAIVRAVAARRSANDLQARLDDLLTQVDVARRHLAEATDEALQAELDAPEPEHLGTIQLQIDNVETINAQAREYGAYQRVIQRLADVQASADLLTEQIAEIDKRKADGLAAAKFPGGLPLGFDETGVLLNGIPFKQASGAEQLRASLAMAIALNPGLRVIRIADGSLLDSEGLKLVGDMAAANDYQVWIEVVSDGDGEGIIIEDGAVVDPDFF